LELWLVRHGLTDANQEGRLQGQIDYPLNEEGRKQAFLLAERCQGTRFAFCLSSPLLRTRQTAQIIHEVAGCPPPLYTSLLLEYHWGIIQGMTKEQLKRCYPGLAARLDKDFHRTPIPGAEGLPRLFQRVKRFCQWLERLEQLQAPEKPVLVVSHGRFLHALMLVIFPCDFQQSWPFPMDNASLSVLEENFNGRTRLKLFNDCCHIKE